MQVNHLLAVAHDSQHASAAWTWIVLVGGAMFVLWLILGWKPWKKRVTTPPGAVTIARGAGKAASSARNATRTQKAQPDDAA